MRIGTLTAMVLAAVSTGGTLCVWCRLSRPAAHCSVRDWTREPGRKDRALFVGRIWLLLRCRLA